MIDIHDERLGRIKIKSLPNGDAPTEIKEKWIGMELPCLYYDPYAFLKEPLSGKPRVGVRAFAVLQAHALQLLSSVSPTAVEFWNSIGYPQGDWSTWFFDEGCAEILKPPLTKAQICGENN